jgi:O-antigen ligase
MPEGTNAGASPAQRWGDRCLTVGRGAAVAGVCVVTFSTALTSIATAVLLASWAISGQAARSVRASLRHPLGVALLVFFAVAGIGMLYSPAPWPDRLSAVASWRRLGYALLLLGFFAADDWKRRFVVSFVVVTSIGLFASYLAAFGLIPSKPGQGTGALLQNHSTQGIVFSLAVLCLAHLARSASARVRWALFSGAALFAVNVMYITPGRSGYAALVVAAFVSGAMLFGWRRIHIWLSIVVVLGAVAFMTAAQLRERIFQGIDEIASADSSKNLTSMGTRVLFYRTTLELIRERPLFGYGSGSFGKVYSALVAKRYTDWRAGPTTDPHNQYLFIAMELGLVGLVAFLAVLITGFWSAARAGPYGWIAGGVLAVLCVTSLFSSHFRTFAEGHLIGLFLGAMLAAEPGARSTR